MKNNYNCYVHSWTSKSSDCPWCTVNQYKINDDVHTPVNWQALINATEVHIKELETQLKVQARRIKDLEDKVFPYDPDRLE